MVSEEKILSGEELPSTSLGVSFDNKVLQENLVDVSLVNNVASPESNYTSEENQINPCSDDTYQADPCTSTTILIYLFNI